MTLLAVLASLAVGTAAPRAAAAQTAKAERAAKAHYLKGAKLFNAKQYDQALAEYRAAYALSPKPALLFNIARALHEKGDRTEALAHYRRYLAEAPTGPVAAEAREYAAALERELAPPHVSAETPATPPAEKAPAEPPPAAPPPVTPLAAPANPEAASAEVVTKAETTPEPSPFRAGLFAGLSAATISWADWNGGFRFGPAVGVFGSYAPAPWFALRMEVLYAQKGSGSDTVNYMASWRMDYLDAVLLGQAWYWHANFVLGAYAGKHIGGDTPFDEAFLKGGDFGLVVGAGLALPVGGGAATVDLRYEHGLSSLKNDADAFSRVVLFTVGYSMR
ncbi:MAG TPA: outer membrane beta-barrel protein [Haliangiales bacterium]|nr:outer membrane beta-barrel protein [Haliangiales bacterium]